MTPHRAAPAYRPGSRALVLDISCVLSGKTRRHHARLAVEIGSALAIMALSVLCAMSDLGWLSGPAVNAPLLAQAIISYRYRL